MGHSNSMLRRVLQANGVFSIGSALALLVFAAPLARVMGLPGPIWLWALAPGLLAFGLLVLALGRKERPEDSKVRLVIWLDWGWVVASGGVLLFLRDHLSTLGTWLLVDVALIVGAFAALQQFGLHRARTGGVPVGER